MKAFGTMLAVVVVLATVTAAGAAAGSAAGPQPPGGQGSNPNPNPSQGNGGANPPTKGSSPKPSQQNPGTNPPGPGSRPSGQRPGAKPRPARPARPPHRLWYRISLNVTEKGFWEGQDHVKWTAVWGADSSSAVIVENVCRAGTRIFSDRCSYAFRGRHRPAGAVDDLSFTAGVNGEYLKLSFESVRPAFEVIEPPGPFGSDVVRCGAKTTTVSMTKPALYRGTLSASSLVGNGLGIAMGYPAKLRGEMQADVSSQTCTRELARPLGAPAESITNTSSPAHDVWVVMGAPWEVTAGGFADIGPAEIGPVLKVPNGAGRFGSSFIVKKTISRPYGGPLGKVEATVSLVFTLCPRGGRAVKPC